MKREKITAQEAETIRISAIKDACRYSIFALPIIILSELGFIIFWLATSLQSTTPNWGYFACYVFLFLTSCIALTLIFLWRKSAAKHVKALVITQGAYVFCLVVWVVALTHLEAIRNGIFYITVYATIMTIVPVFTYLNPWYWMSLQISGDIYIFVLGWFYQGEGRSGFLANFVIFAIMSSLSSFIFYLVRRRGYLKQQQYAALSELNKHHAYYDSLTNLQNRRSYSERMDGYDHKGIPDGLCYAMVDINQLKTANDQYGHEAGDELIIEAAKIIENEFGNNSCYRIGGDEFIIMCFLSAQEVDEKLEKAMKACGEWKGSYPITLSLSYGVVYPQEAKTLSLMEVSALADKRMYANKDKFYQDTGIERRKI